MKLPYFNLNLAFILSISLVFLGSCTPMQKTRIVLLPDTQTYAEKYPHILDAQVSYILREEKNIDFVLQQGDLTQNNNDAEWQVVKNAFTRLDQIIPYVLAAGNHDMGSAPGKFADNRNTQMFNQYFDSGMYSLPGYITSFERGKLENSYYKFEKDKIKWLVLSLEFGPRNAVLDWAGNIVSGHPDHLVILNTHSYMYSDSTRQGPGDSWRPQAYGVGKAQGDNSVNDGEHIWNKLVSLHPNIRFVFSGHVLNSGVGTLISINKEGLPVYQMLANYQEGVKGSENGGNGWLRIIDLDHKKNTISVTTYSPFLNSYMEDAHHKFVIRNAYLKPGNK